MLNWHGPYAMLCDAEMFTSTKCSVLKMISVTLRMIKNNKYFYVTRCIYTNSNNTCRMDKRHSKLNRLGHSPAISSMCVLHRMKIIKKIRV